MYDADAREISIGLVGDCLLTRPLAVFREERFLRIREILNGADATFANLESNIHRYLEDPQPQRGGGGTYMTTEPRLLEDLKWLGIKLLACGSSHAEDYGWKGILDTIRYLDEAGIAHAGSGRHLAEARSPGYYDTPRGRVALVAATSHINAGARAGEQRLDTAGHPGVNGLRSKQTFVVDRATLDDLRRIGRSIGWAAEVERRASLGDPPHGDSDESYNLLGQTFVLGSEFSVRSSARKSDV